MTAPRGRKAIWHNRLWFAAGGVLAVLLVAGYASLSYAVRYRPGYYREALALDAHEAKAESDEFVALAGAVAASLQEVGRWQTTIPVAAINGWLAHDLPRNHASLLPTQFAEPRVAFEEGRARLACQYRSGGWEAVMTLDLDLALAAPETLAVRVRSARAGLLPAPVGSLLAEVAAAANAADVPLRWSTADGDPVALIHVGALAEHEGRRCVLESVELRDGELYLAGRVERRADLESEPDLDGEGPRLLPARAAQSAEKLTRHE